MRLQRLTGLERDKILEEHAEMLKQIARYKEILADEREVLQDHRRRAARGAASCTATSAAREIVDEIDRHLASRT